MIYNYVSSEFGCFVVICMYLQEKVYKYSLFILLFIRYILVFTVQTLLHLQLDGVVYQISKILQQKRPFEIKFKRVPRSPIIFTIKYWKVVNMLKTRIFLFTSTNLDFVHDCQEIFKSSKMSLSYKEILKIYTRDSGTAQSLIKNTVF